MAEGAQGDTIRREEQVDGSDLLLSAEPHIGDLDCPHCGSPTYRRSSKLVTITFREIFYVCRNVACGHTYKASLSYEYGLSPSAIPNPDLDLPMRPMERVPGVNTRQPTGPPEVSSNQPGLFD
jgi:hypothetical protein